jgi:hypothetical protein
MKYIGNMDSRLIPGVKSLDVRQVLSYAVVSILLLLAIYALLVHPETDSSQLMSTLTLP